MRLVPILLLLAGCSSGNTQSDMAPPDLKPTRKVFVTQAQYTGLLGGLPGADSDCAGAAAAAGLPGSSSAWVAWLSDSSTNAIDRIPDVGPWTRTDGMLAFASKADLMKTPAVALDVDEYGTVHHVVNVWTGTDVGGTASAGGLSATCQDWSTNNPNNAMPAPMGVTGSTDFKDAQWTNQLARPCQELHSIYCFQIM